MCAGPTRIPRAWPPTSSTATARAPRIFMSCGNQDPLAEPNRVLAGRMRDTGLDVTYHEMDGGHDWDFWNAALPEALNWLIR